MLVFKTQREPAERTHALSENAKRSSQLVLTNPLSLNPLRFVVSFPKPNSVYRLVSLSQAVSGTTATLADNLTQTFFHNSTEPASRITVVRMRPVYVRQQLVLRRRTLCEVSRPCGHYFRPIDVTFPNSYIENTKGAGLIQRPFLSFLAH